MSEAKFTPGRWSIYTFSDGVMVGNADQLVAEVMRSELDPDRVPTVHNAALIAAAPKLYSLLQELIDIEGPQPGTAMWADKVFAALREARGEKP